MITLKSPREIEMMDESGELLADVHIDNLDRHLQYKQSNHLGPFSCAKFLC